MTNPTLVYLEQLSPIPALAAGNRLGDVANNLHFQVSGHTRNKRSEINNESGKLSKRFFFFIIMSWENYSSAAANVSSPKLDNL